MIIIVGTFAQALSGQAAAVKIIGVLVVWRFIVCILNIPVKPSNLTKSSRWELVLEAIIL